MPRLTPLRTSLLGLGITTALVVGGIALFMPTPIPAPAVSSDSTVGQPVGIGPLLEGARGALPSDGVRAAAQDRAKAELPGAPDAIVDLATRLFMGEVLTAQDLEGMDPHLLAYVFHAPQSLDTGGGSLAREAAALGRLDVLRVMGESGVSTDADGGLLFWAAIENWAPETAADGQALFAQAALEQGVHRAHEDGFTALELAATVSVDAVAALIAAGGNPWTHPTDPDEALGFPSMMERLSLHAGAKGALGVLDGVVTLAALPVPSQRAHWNTVGNLIDSAILLEAEGRPAEARQAAGLATGLEGRFGPVPVQFWSDAARRLRPIGAPDLAPIRTPEDALAEIPHAAPQQDLSGDRPPLVPPTP